jgi:hypothetical protein
VPARTAAGDGRLSVDNFFERGRKWAAQYALLQRRNINDCLGKTISALLALPCLLLLPQVRVPALLRHGRSANDGRVFKNQALVAGDYYIKADRQETLIDIQISETQIIGSWTLSWLEIFGSSKL